MHPTPPPHHASLSAFLSKPFLHRLYTKIWVDASPSAAMLLLIHGVLLASMPTWLPPLKPILMMVTIHPVMPYCMGAFTFISTLIGTQSFIDFSHRQAVGQAIREDGPASHHLKAGTPTGGGIVFVGVSLLTLALAMLWQTQGISKVTWLALGAVSLLAGLGLVDDYQKIAKKHNKGVSGYTKLTVQAIAGILIASLSWKYGEARHIFLNMPWFAPMFESQTGLLALKSLWWTSSTLVMMGASNAVNLTDGLDGLAGSTSKLTFMGLITALVLCHSNNPRVLDWVDVLWVFAWSLLGFLCFNRNKANIFMGDTGSLFLGGLMAGVVLMMGEPWWLLGLGLLFVLETLSVILQVGSFKLTGKRLFKMAPWHHHLELSGWKEQNIVAVFWLLQLLAIALTLWGMTWMNSIYSSSS
ncbi:MAG: phospho-N-acetylmuramoyl-pentapeptide-transferase [Vampirovibrionales bacterium]